MSAAHEMTGDPLSMRITPLERAARVYRALSQAVWRHSLLCRQRCARARACEAGARYGKQIEAASVSYDALVALHFAGPRPSRGAPSWHRRRRVAAS